MALFVKYRFKKCCLPILVLLVAVLPYMIGVPSALPEEPAGGTETLESSDQTGTEEAASRPLTVIVDNVETTSDVPVINKGGRIYVPVRFLAESLGYPVEWEEEKGTVYIGIRPSGTDMVSELAAYTGRKIKQPVKISGIGYPKGYVLTMGALGDVRWKLNGRYLTVSFSMGVPDNQSGDSAEFTVIADGKTLAKEKYLKMTV
jgi:Copper amine oxidase N-terminal domain./NPCBM/NEW2 domain.